MTIRAAVACLLLLPATALAQIQSGAWRPAVADAATAEAPARLQEAVALAPIASLPRAAEGARDQLAALAAWNARGVPPLQNGFSRPLPVPLELSIAASPPAVSEVTAGRLERLANGDRRWRGRVVVEGSFRLRLHLEGVSLPPGARLWVYGDRGEWVGPFGAELLGPDGDLWTPSVGGPAITLEARLPVGAALSLKAREVLELVDLEENRNVVHGAVDYSCLVDAECVSTASDPNITALIDALGELQFVKNSVGYLCSGGLLNDANSSFIPYLLTADHCFSTQASTSTLEVFWQYYNNGCGGGTPSFGSLPRSNGGTLLATSLQSDFTFVRLNGLPSGPTYFFLGWNASSSVLTNNKLMKRVSFPFPTGAPDVLPGQYSQQSFLATPVYNCNPDSDGRPINDPSKFLHSVQGQGATFPGSSGSPVIIAGGYVVGQLYGACGPQNGRTEKCLYKNQYDVLDGAFAASYASLAQWLSPTPPTGACVPGATTLCLDDSPGDRRFEVKVSFASNAGSGNANAISLAGLGVSRGGLFWFFGADNPELLVKVLNGCSLGNHFWVFVSAGTNVAVSMTVRDTVLGHMWTKSTANGTPFPTVQDTAALTCS